MNLITRRGTVVALAALVAASFTIGAVGCGEDNKAGSSSNGDTASSEQASIDKMAAFGLSSPEANRWDEGGNAAFEKAAGVLNADPTWLSNITFDQSPQLLDRLVSSGNKMIISNGSGFGEAMTDAARKNPDTWFVVYSGLADTAGLKNLAGVDLYWNQMGYLAAAIACKARSDSSKKIALIIAQPIPAYMSAAAGVEDGAKAGCGSTKSLILTWTGTFDDNSKTKQATEAAISQGAEVVIDFQDAATPGVQAAVKANPKVKYVGTMFDFTTDMPKQIVTSVTIDYDQGYLSIADNYKKNTLEPKVYPSGVQQGGILLTPFTNSSQAVVDYGNQLYDDIKSGALKVDLKRQVKP